MGPFIILKNTLFFVAFAEKTLFYPITHTVFMHYAQKMGKIYCQQAIEIFVRIMYYIQYKILMEMI